MKCNAFFLADLKHVECVMKDNVAVVRLNSPDNKVASEGSLHMYVLIKNM